jgi:hypothetical protein
VASDAVMIILNFINIAASEAHIAIDAYALLNALIHSGGLKV